MKTQFKGQGMLVPLLLCLFCLLTTALQAYAQQQVVQFSGLVTSSDSLQSLAGASVYVPNTTRGVQTTGNGFFSLPVLPGDSVVISMLGYQKQYIIIPGDYSNQSYTTHIQLQESPTQLPTVDVMPWATEQDLKAAVARVKLPEEPELKVDLGPLQYNSILHGPQMDANDNARHGVQQQLYQLNGRHMIQNGIRLFGAPIR